MILAFIGNFCNAKTKVSNNILLFKTLEISNKIIPALTSKTTETTGPLPLPIRNSKGFFVIVLCGQNLTHNRPIPLIDFAMILREASI